MPAWEPRTIADLCCPLHRWRQFVDDCKNFLSWPEKWAERAAELGWDAMALFGCAPKRPGTPLIP